MHPFGMHGSAHAHLYQCTHLACGSQLALTAMLHVLVHRRSQVLPLENVHGRDLVESGQLCERKNGRGVDPNRNWDIDWGKKEKDYDPKEEFPGRAPLR